MVKYHKSERIKLIISFVHAHLPLVQNENFTGGLNNVSPEIFFQSMQNSKNTEVYIWSGYGRVQNDYLNIDLKSVDASKSHTASEMCFYSQTSLATRCFMDTTFNIPISPVDTVEPR